MTETSSIVLVQVAIADYRDAFVRLLYERVPTLQIQVGDEYFEPSTRTSMYVREAPSTLLLDNHFLLDRRLCWQSLNWKKIIAADTLIAELNPRILSTWIALALRKALRRRSVLWGHAWSRAGASSKTEPLRHAMRRMADGVLLYTNQQREELLGRYPSLRGRLFVAPNSLYLSDEMLAIERTADTQTDFIYVGRLVRAKKVDVLIRAFSLFLHQHPTSKLHIVGDGDEAPALRQIAAKGLSDSVLFYGHIAEPAILRGLYEKAIASVSPGYVGLSITQSFSFGVPMIISRNEPHSPEIEAFAEGLNGSYFDTDEPNSLAAQMEYWYQRRIEAGGLALSIVDHCRHTYSVERMVSGFCEAATG